LSWDIEITPEDEEEMIEKLATEIHKRDLDIVAILALEIMKPLSYVGAQLSRAFISPFLPAFGDDIGIGGEKAMQFFENKENVENLLTALEKMTEETKEKEKEAKLSKSNEDFDKPWWKKILPL